LSKLWPPPNFNKGRDIVLAIAWLLLTGAVPFVEGAR
jgi:hypothetical protein